MYGNRAFELIKELERHKSRFAAFDENGLRQIFEEMQALFEQNRRDSSLAMSTTAASTELRAGIQLRHAALERNKQCVLTYLYTRLQQIRDIRWTQGSVLPQDVRSNMTDQEIQFFNNYNKVLANYMRSIGENTGLDLTMDLDPPKQLMIEVKVIKDYGEFETDTGDIILLKKDSIHFLPRTQCEGLIRQGILERT